MPMSWIAGGATVINLVLGTGPFSYPQIFAESGIILAPVLMLVVLFVAFITSQYIIEAISITCAKNFTGRKDSLYPLMGNKMSDTPDN